MFMFMWGKIFARSYLQVVTMSCVSGDWEDMDGGEFSPSRHCGASSLVATQKQRRRTVQAHDLAFETCKLRRFKKTDTVYRRRPWWSWLHNKQSERWYGVILQSRMWKQQDFKHRTWDINWARWRDGRVVLKKAGEEEEETQTDWSLLGHLSPGSSTDKYGCWEGNYCFSQLSNEKGRLGTTP